MDVKSENYKMFSQASGSLEQSCVITLAFAPRLSAQVSEDLLFYFREFWRILDILSTYIVSVL